MKLSICLLLGLCALSLLSTYAEATYGHGRRTRIGWRGGCFYWKDKYGRIRSYCKTSGRKPTCSSCSSSRQCRSKKCWGSPGKCTTKGDYDELVTCGFKQECSDCTSSLQCATKKCWGPGGGVATKCVFKTRESIEKCFPKPKKEICDTCSAGTECKSGNCFGGKCISTGSTEELISCGFKKECDSCNSPSECATKSCSGPGNGIPNKCVFETMASMEKCFPKPKNELCETCATGTDCKSDKCFGGKCISTGSLEELLSCGFKKECESCSSPSDCATKICSGPGNGAPNKCLFDTDASMEKCFPKPKNELCETCSTGADCKSDKCFGGKCISTGSPEELISCGFKKECDSCSSPSECATKNCSGPGNGAPTKCLFDTAASKEKCFPAPKKDLCARCSRNSDCKSGKCWGVPLKCTSTGSYEELLSCGFKKECETCSKNGECATDKCQGRKGGDDDDDDDDDDDNGPKKCTFGDRSSLKKCFMEEKKAECAECKKDSECATGKCWGRPAKCVSKTAGYEALLKCGFKRNCKSCDSEFECASKVCSNHLCVVSRSDNTCH